MRKTYLAGVTGCSGSGKTTFVNLVEAHLQKWGTQVARYRVDNDYRDYSNLSWQEREALYLDSDRNFDHPNSVDFERTVRHLEAIKRGEEIRFQRYDFSQHCHGEEEDSIAAGQDVVLVDGIFAGYQGPEIGEQEDALRRLYNLFLFVNGSPSCSLQRRIVRDAHHRVQRKEAESLADPKFAIIREMYARFVEPTKMYADEVLDGEWRFGSYVHENGGMLDFRLVMRKMIDITQHWARRIHQDRFGPSPDSAVPRLSAGEFDALELSFVVEGETGAESFPLRFG